MTKVIVSQEKRKELADLFLKLSGEIWWTAIYQDEFRANLLVDEVVEVLCGPETKVEK
jgi:hypothetical protein